MEYIGSPNLGPTLGSDPKSLEKILGYGLWPLVGFGQIGSLWSWTGAGSARGRGVSPLLIQRRIQ